MMIVKANKISKDTLFQPLASSDSAKIFFTAVNNELKRDEVVRWTTRPNSIYSMKPALSHFLFGIPWNYFVLLELAEILSKDQPIHEIIFFIPFLLVGIYLFLSPFIEWYKARNSLYVITNKRAFIITKALSKIFVENYYPENLCILDKFVRLNGSGDLIFSREHHTDNDGGKQSTDYGFFALPNVKEAEMQIELLIGT